MDQSVNQWIGNEMEESVDWLWTGNVVEKRRRHCQRNSYKGNSIKIHDEFEKQDKI